MGRISDIIPLLYYDKQNNLIRFTECLDAEVRELERKVKGITDLVSIDNCPDDKLPYLAALTNCPLMGNDPALWRRQILNWPYILRIKGTERSLDVFLNSIDVDEHKLYTFFRDVEGNLVEDKPTGAPFQDSSGLWRNIRTHYFDLDIVYGNEHFLTWTEWHKDFLRSMNIWLTRAKPFHSELRNLRVILQREEQQDLFVGTATGQATQHNIAFVPKTYSEDSQLITIGAGTFQTTHHDIAIVQGTHSASECDIAVGAGIVQGGHYDVDMVQGTSANSRLDVSIGTGTFHTWTHDVRHVQATEADADSVIAIGSSVIQSTKHEVDIQQHTSGCAGLDISVGTSTVQKVSHDVKILQATHSAAEGDISVGAGVIVGSVHAVDMKRPTSARAQVCVPVGIGILQSAIHAISVGISTIAKTEIFVGAGLTQTISHDIGIKKAEGSSTTRLSACCAIACGIHMQIKMAA